MSNAIMFASNGTNFMPIECNTQGILKVDTIALSTPSIGDTFDYDLELAGPTVYADSSPIFVENPQGQNGWYYQSVNSASSSNVYFYGNNPSFIQSNIIYNTVKSIFAVVDLNFIGTISNNLPILVIGTKPTGNQDHIPLFAHSVQTYSIPSTEILVLNERVLLYADIGNTSYQLPDTLYEGVRRIKCELSSSNGTNFTALPIAYASINTQTLSQSVRYTLYNAGLSFLNSTEDTISNWGFVNSKARKAETNLSNLTFTGASIDVSLDCDSVVLTETADIADKNALVVASSMYAYSAGGAVVENLTFSNPSYLNNEAVKNRLDTSTVLYDGVNNNNSNILPINSVLLNGTNGLVCSSVLMGTKENDETSRLLMTDDNILKVNSNLITGFATETTLDEIRDQTTKLQFTSTTNFLKVNNENNITGFATEATLDEIRDQTTKLQFTNTTNYLKTEIQNASLNITGNVGVPAGVNVNTLPNINSTTNSIEIVGKDNTNAQRTILTGATGKLQVDGTVNVITGFGLETTQTAIKNKTDNLQFTTTTNYLKVKVEEMPTISGSVSVSNGNTNPVIIGGYDGTNDQVIKTDNNGKLDVVGSVSVNNASIDTHCYGSSNGTLWHHLKTDTNGILNTHSRTEDGTGNSITSTLIGSDRGLDVNILNPSTGGGVVQIEDTDGNKLSAVSNTVPQLKTTLYDSSGAEFGTIATPIIIGGFNGTTEYPIKTNTNGQLYSAVCDGGGQEITSSTGLGTTRGLDVNVLNSVNIKDSDGNVIKALAGTGRLSGALKVQSIGSTNNADIADISSSYAGSSYVSQANFITNGYDRPVCMGGWSGSGTGINVVKANANYALLTAFDTANNTVGLSTTANTVKLDTSNNTVKFSQTTTENNIKITDASGDVATVSTPTSTAATTIRGLDTQALVNARDIYNDTYDNLTMTNSLNPAPSVAYKALDTYIRNPTTTNTTISGYTTNNVGISTYQILPKIKSFSMSGYNGSGAPGTAPADTILGGYTTTLTSTSINFGLQNPRTYYLFTPTGWTAGRVIKYIYVDASGNEQSGTQTITALNTYYALPSAISINQFGFGGTNLTAGTGDSIYLTTSNTASNTLYVGNILQQRIQSNGVFTCPNNAIAMITNIDGYCGTAYDIYHLNIYDATGNRSTLAQYTIWNNTVANQRASGGGDYACFGRILTAGESVVFSTSQTNSSYKYITYNILVRYF